MPPDFVPPGLDAPKRPRVRDLAQVSKVMSQIADEAAFLPEPYVRQLLPILDAAREELRRDLRSWMDDVQDGNLRFTAQHYRHALMQMEGSLDHLRTRVPEAVFTLLVRADRGAGNMAVGHLEREVAKFASVFGQSVRPLSLERVAIMADGRRARIHRYQNSANRYGRDMANDFRRQLAIGLARGETFHQMTDRLIRHGGPRGWVPLRGMGGHEFIPEGLFRRYRHWGERVVRTEAMSAYNEGHLAALRAANRDDPGYLARWDATADRVCPICRDLDGAVTALNRPFKGGYAHPPAHPNCRCVTTPWREQWSTSERATRSVAKQPNTGAR